MRKVLAIAILGLLLVTLPALATSPDKHDSGPFTGGNGHGARSQTCPGQVIWDTGMQDNFTPPTGCSSSFSVGCFVNAINDGGFVQDWRKGAAEFIGTAGMGVTQIKVWARYNAQGYDYHLATPGSLHGFCIKFYDDPTQGAQCPDGSVPGEVLGLPVYDQYSSTFVEEEILTGLPRNFDYCITLPQQFCVQGDHLYWASVSADFDFTSFESGVTQYFWRLAGPGTALICDPAWRNCDGTGQDNGCAYWMPVWQGVNLPCWQGWDAAYILYATDCVPVTGACCFADGSCQVLSAAACQQQGGQYQGDGTVCNPNPCHVVPVKTSTWGAIKAKYR